jgi:uncharacterized protein (UPF0212 family)
VLCGVSEKVRKEYIKKYLCSKQCPLCPTPVHPLNLICTSIILWPLLVLTVANTDSFEKEQQLRCLGTNLRSKISSVENLRAD